MLGTEDRVVSSRQVSYPNPWWYAFAYSECNLHGWCNSECMNTHLCITQTQTHAIFSIPARGLHLCPLYTRSHFLNAGAGPLNWFHNSQVDCSQCLIRRLLDKTSGRREISPGRVHCRGSSWLSLRWALISYFHWALLLSWNFCSIMYLSAPVSIWVSPVAKQNKAFGRLQQLPLFPNWLRPSVWCFLMTPNCSCVL